MFRRSASYVAPFALAFASSVAQAQTAPAAAAKPVAPSPNTKFPVSRFRPACAAQRTEPRLAAPYHSRSIRPAACGWSRGRCTFPGDRMMVSGPPI